MSVRKRGLGKGLDALLSSRNDISLISETAVEKVADGTLRQVPVEFIQRGKYQPRRDMSADALEELSASIKAQGVMQPIVIRPIDSKDERYEIIAGERRWRASQLAGLDSIPAVIRTVSDEDAIAMALIENIQRENLNPMEEAIALQRLKQEFELTQQQVADAVGKSRVTVTNLLRLIALTDDVKRMLEHGDLEMGHARALLSLSEKDQIHAAKQVVAKGLTVRQTESLVRKLNQPDVEVQPSQQMTANVKSLETSLAQRLGASVDIKHKSKGNGQLVIKYNSLAELDGILKHIK
ncbi:ParB/RepB/Spo0J family partition protein [Marinicellulosiphila megalodicopiae]|uniref:ParB/RepB/Spo0J family partition protein n=1 Tax=Marinicellulosiphila megalodicopiae TaxID=2724896 RepID=UPI003BB08A1C